MCAAWRAKARTRQKHYRNCACRFHLFDFPDVEDRIVLKQPAAAAGTKLGKAPPRQPEIWSASQ
jgi:hypothetical protein